MSSRGSAASVSWLLGVGGVALGSAFAAGSRAVRRASPADLVTGSPAVDASALVVGGGLSLVGFGAVLFALVLLLGRV